MSEILSTREMITIKDYEESAVILMNALGFTPTEPIGLVSSPAPE
jgi:hypothetical protein